MQINVCTVHGNFPCNFEFSLYRFVKNPPTSENLNITESIKTSKKLNFEYGNTNISNLLKSVRTRIFPLQRRYVLP